MRQHRKYGSVRGVAGNGHPYRDGSGKPVVSRVPCHGATSTRHPVESRIGSQLRVAFGRIYRLLTCAALIVQATR